MRRDGSPFYAEWRGTVFTYQGRRRLLILAKLDVAGRTEAVALVLRHALVT